MMVKQLREAIKELPDDAKVAIISMDDDEQDCEPFAALTLKPFPGLLVITHDQSYYAEHKPI